MNLAKLIPTRGKSTKDKKREIKKSFGDPEFILKQLSNFLDEGDFSSSTDLISVYISNSCKYKNQNDFAVAIGTTRQTLHRMFAHENVSLNIFFSALEQIWNDAHSS